MLASGTRLRPPLAPQSRLTEFLTPWKCSVNHVDIVGGYMVRSFLFSAFLFISALSTSSNAVELEQVGNLPVSLFGATVNGRVLVKGVGKPHVFLWEPAEKNWNLIYQPDGTGPIAEGFGYATTRSGLRLLVQEKYRATRGNEKLATGLKVVDLSAPQPKSVNIPETRDHQTMPVVSPDDSEFLFFTAQLFTKPVWKFPLAEFLFDVEQGSAQPTGFYLNEIPELSTVRSAVTGSYSPDGSKVALVEGAVSVINPRGSAYDDYDDYDEDGDYDEDEDDDRYGYGGYGGYGRANAQGRTIKIYDFTTRKLTEIPVKDMLAEIYWPQDDTLIGVTKGYSTNGSIVRIKISTKEQEAIEKDSSAISEVSPDGKWITFRREGGYRNDPSETQYLYNIEHRSRYEFKNASLAVFNPTSSELVLQTLQGPDDLLARVDLTPYNDRTAPASVDVKKPDVAKQSAIIPVYKAPEDAKELAESFEFIEPNLNFAGSHYMPLFRLQVKLRSKSTKFLQLKESKNNGITVELRDPLGAVIELEPPGPSQRAPLILGPGEATEYSYILRAKAGALPPAFTGKLKVVLDGYDFSREFTLK